MLLGGGLVRDWSNGKLLAKRQRKTPAQLFWELSKKRKVDWRGRLQRWLIVFFGGYIYDVHAREVRQLAQILDPTEDKKSG